MVVSRGAFLVVEVMVVVIGICDGDVGWLSWWVAYCCCVGGNGSGMVRFVELVLVCVVLCQYINLNF